MHSQYIILIFTEEWKAGIKNVACEQVMPVEKGDARGDKK